MNYLKMRGNLKNIIKKILFIIILFVNCGSSIKQRTITYKKPLRVFHKVVLILKTSPENEQTYLAMENLKFKLFEIGFEIVDNIKDADAIITLQIGTVRFDLLTGWIADEAFLQFIDRRTSKTFAMFHAKTRFITPTVKNIISNLASAIKKQY